MSDETTTDRAVPEDGKRWLHRRIDNDLTLHPPKHPYIGQVMDELRTEGKLFAHLLIDRCPNGRELSMALTDVEHATQHAIAAIARNQDGVLRDAGVPPEDEGTPTPDDE